MNKLFRPSGVGKATVIIAITSLLSYAIGLLRDRIIAINFGTTSATDAYNASFLIPDMLFNLFIAGALSAAFLPIFSDYLVKDKKQAYTLANTMLTGACYLITALAIIAFIFMEKIVIIAFPSALPEMQKEIITMTKLLLPSAILFAISNTLGNILMSYKHFIAYAISPILYNLGIIIGILLFRENLGIYSAALGVICGASLHCAIRIIDIFYTDYRYKIELKPKHPGFKKILKLMIPKSISLIAWQINLYIFAIVGIRVLEGSFAAFNYARNIQSFAVSLFGIAFATAVFPYLTSSVSENNTKKYTVYIRQTIQRILFFTIPAMAGIMILSEETVTLILSGGVFDENSVKLTTGILFFFAISIPFESLVHILARGFYALKNTLTPMLINISAMTMIGAITIFIAPKWGVNWFSIGFSLGYIFQVSILIIFLKKHLNEFRFKRTLLSISKTIIATSIMAAFLIATKSLNADLSLFPALAIRVSIGASIFFATAWLLKSSEISAIKMVYEKITHKQASK